MPIGMPGQKTIHVKPDEIQAMGKLIDEEMERTGKELTEYSIMKAALRKYLKLE